MLRWLRVTLIAMLVIPIVGVLVAIIGLAVARMSLPATACTVSEASIASFVVEKTTESEVIAKLGCDGVHDVQLDAEGLRIETISWRGDAWPYSVFEAYLVNGVLHGAKVIRLNLEAAYPSGQSETVAD
jgi:hypothetical protein